MTRNITLAIDETVLDRARVIAAERKTTVNALVRDYLAAVVAEKDRMASARERLLDLIDSSQDAPGSDYRWNRDEIYEERLLSRHQRPDLRGGGEKS